MTMRIKLNQHTYSRLESIAQGFGDKPGNVIRKLLDYYEGKYGFQPAETVQAVKEDIRRRPIPEFYPNGMKDFRRRLLVDKRAVRRVTYQDGGSEILLWKAENFRPESNLMGNINTGVLRDWRQKGIVRLEIAIDIEDLPTQSGK